MSLNHFLYSRLYKSLNVKTNCVFIRVEFLHLFPNQSSVSSLIAGVFANRFLFLIQLSFPRFKVQLFRLSVFDEQFESFALIGVLMFSEFVVVVDADIVVKALLGLTNFENSERKIWFQNVTVGWFWEKFQNEIFHEIKGSHSHGIAYFFCLVLRYFEEKLTVLHLLLVGGGKLPNYWSVLRYLTINPSNFPFCWWYYIKTFPLWRYQRPLQTLP